jgi:hypothetical protein
MPTAEPVLGTFAAESMSGQQALLPKSINMPLRRRNFCPLTTPTAAIPPFPQCHIDVVSLSRRIDHFPLLFQFQVVATFPFSTLSRALGH